MSKIKSFPLFVSLNLIELSTLLKKGLKQPKIVVCRGRYENKVSIDKYN